MAGETDYVSNRVSEVKVQLDDIERQVGINNVVHNPEAERLLGLSEKELDKMTPDDCANAKYILNQHSLTIQIKLNRAISLRNWCERSITLILAKEYANIDSFMTYEVKREFVAKMDGYASRLKEISVEQQQIIDTLSFLPKAISDISNSFQPLGYNKRKDID